MQMTPSSPCDSQLAGSYGQVGGHPVVVQSGPPEVPELGLGPATPPHSVSWPDTMAMGNQDSTSSSPGRAWVSGAQSFGKTDLIR